MRADDEDFDALCDQCLNVCLFLGGVALAEENFDFVAGSRKGVFEAGLILDPARFILRGKHNANGPGYARCGGIQTCEVAGGPVAGVDHSGFDIVPIHSDHFGRLGGNVNLAVVVGVGLRGSLPLQVCNGGADRIRDQGADILQHGHGLLAVNDVLDRSLLGILTGHHVTGNVAVCRERIGDRAGGSIVRGENEHVALIGGGRHGQICFCKGLGGVEIPVGGDLTDDLAHLVAGQACLVLQGNRLAGVLDDECAVGDLGLQDVPGTLEEQEGIVVGCRARIQVQRVAGAARLVNEVLSLRCAHSDAVERDVVVHRIGVEDQAVVGNDFHACGSGGFRGGGGGRTVMRCNDDHLDALADQGLDVRFFLGGVALAEEDLHLVASLRQCVLEAGLVLDPARFILRREHDPNFQRGSCRLLRGFCAATSG